MRPSQTALSSTSVWLSDMAFFHSFTGELQTSSGEAPGQVSHNELVHCTATYTFEGFCITDDAYFLDTPQGVRSERRRISLLLTS